MGPVFGRNTNAVIGDDPTNSIRSGRKLHPTFAYLFWFQVLDNPAGGAVLVMEYIDIKPLRKYAAQLGEQLAR